MITVWDGFNWSNGIPNRETSAIFAADFMATKSLSAKEIEVLPEIKLTIAENTTLTVMGDFKTAKSSKVIFEEDAQFIQKNPNALTPPADYTTKTAFILKFDYTYFSSPVAGQAINMIRDDGVDLGLNAGYVNPNGIPANTYLPPRFDKYWTWDQNAPTVGTDNNVYSQGAWLLIPETTVMSNVGKGYIVRGPDSFPANLGEGPAQKWWVKFSGIANSGVIASAINGVAYSPFYGVQTPLPSPLTLPYETCNNALYRVNLIGNPYPSALDADTFLTNPANVAALDGAVYLWSHNSGPSAANPGNGLHGINYTANDYLAYNLIGGIGSGRVTGQPFYAPNESNRPIGKIAMGQAFFVRGITNGSGSATFNPDMQDTGIIPEEQQFFRGVVGTDMIPTVPKNRFWLSLEGVTTTGTNLYKETLIGYMNQRSTPAGDYTTNYSLPASNNGYDKMYDTEVFKTVYFDANEVNNRIDFYTMLNATNPCPRLAIQGRNSQFLLNDVIPLGFSCPPGSYTIRAEKSEGIFPVNQRYWLREYNGLGYSYHDILNEDFTFITNTTTSDNTTRFQIVFTLPAIGAVGLACNSTLTGFSTLFNAVGGASNSGMGYNWLFTDVFGNQILNPATGLPLGPINTAGQNFSFTNPNIPLGLIDFDRDYFIRVGIFNASQGIWVYSEEPCRVSTPPRIITVSINQNPCGSMILPDQQVVASGNAPFGYAWQITNLTSNQTVNFTTTNAYFSWTSGVAGSSALGSPGFLALGSQYNIQVAILYQASPQIIGAYSGDCFYNSPAPRPVVADGSDTNAFSDFTVKAFPNPFNSEFNLAIDTENTAPITIDVFDMIGKMMESKVIAVEEISFFKFGNEYATGIYNVIVTQGNIRKNVKLIKR